MISFFTFLLFTNTGFSHSQEPSAVDVSEKEGEITFDPVVMDNSCPPQPKQKLFKEQRNLSRKQDLKPVGQTDQQTEEPRQVAYSPGEEGEDKRGPIRTQHVVVDVEINIIDNNVSDDQKTPSRPGKPCSKRKSTTPQRSRRKPRANVEMEDGAALRPDGVALANSVPSSPSQTSGISDTAAEELCELRNYYSKQLRRINYISHEYLGQPAEPGVLACIREPLRSLRLPHRVTIAQTARSLWTRVSSRRKLIHR